MTAIPQIELAPVSVPPTPARRGSDFSELLRRVRAAGLLERRPASYAARIAAHTLLLATGLGAFFWLGSSWWQLAVAAYLGVVSTQLGFLGHDAGHRQIFRSGRANDLLGMLLANLLVGLSYDWWIGKHNRHHSHPNQLDQDPDLSAGALVWTPEQAQARRGIGRVVARYQAWRFFPMLTLEALNLHVASVRAVLSRRSRSGTAELALLIAHWVGYVGAVALVMSPWHALAFVIVHKAVFGLYLGCSFAPNHKGMPILDADDETDYLRRQVLTARNVRGGWFTHVALGGLNYQIEHHLFPSMPSASLPRCQPLVREFCAERGLPYAETSAWSSYSDVVRYLHHAADVLR